MAPRPPKPAPRPPLSPEMIEGSARDALAVPAVAENVVVLPVAAEAAVAEAGGIGRILKNIVLFFAAPFIGLAYIIALPLVGSGLLAVLAGRAAAKNGTLKAAAVAFKHVAMFCAAPIF